MLGLFSDSLVVLKKDILYFACLAIVRNKEIWLRKRSEALKRSVYSNTFFKEDD